MFSSLRNKVLAGSFAGIVAVSGLPGICADEPEMESKQSQKAAAMFEKGHAALDKKDPRVAEACYRKAVALAPMEGRYHRQLALLLYRTGRGQEAEREVRIAMHLNEEDWQAGVLLGTILHAQRRFDEEIAAYHKTLEILPSGEKAIRDQLKAFIKKDEIAQKEAAEQRKKKKEEEEKPYQNAY